MRLRFDRDAIPGVLLVWGCIISGGVLWALGIKHGWYILSTGVVIGLVRSYRAYRKAADTPMENGGDNEPDES